MGYLGVKKMVKPVWETQVACMEYQGCRPLSKPVKSKCSYIFFYGCAARNGSWENSCATLRWSRWDEGMLYGVFIFFKSYALHKGPIKCCSMISAHFLCANTFPFLTLHIWTHGSGSLNFWLFGSSQVVTFWCADYNKHGIRRRTSTRLE